MKIAIAGSHGLIGTNLVKSVVKKWASDELEVKVLFDIRGLDVPTQTFNFILEPTR